MSQKSRENASSQNIKRLWSSLPKPAKVGFLSIICLILIMIGIGGAMSTPTSTDTKASEQKNGAATETAQKSHDGNTFKEDDKVQLVDMSKDTIKQVLKAPSTAKFQGGLLSPLDGWSFSVIQPNIMELNSVVDSQNSFGAMIRGSFSTTFCKSNDTFYLMHYTFDGQTSDESKTPCAE